MDFRVVTETFAQQNLHSPLLLLDFSASQELGVAMRLSSSQWNVNKNDVSPAHKNFLCVFLHVFSPSTI